MSTPYYDALLQYLEASFGERVKTCGDYDEFQTGDLEVPALLIDIENDSLEGANGDGRTPFVLNVAVHCVLGLQPKIQRRVRDFGMEVQKKLSAWSVKTENLRVTFPKRLSAGKGAFRLGETGYESREVTFTQQIFVGDSVWDVDGDVGKIMLGISPNIGVPHKDDYSEVSETPSV